MPNPPVSFTVGDDGVADDDFDDDDVDDDDDDDDDDEVFMTTAVLLPTPAVRLAAAAGSNSRRSSTVDFSRLSDGTKIVNPPPSLSECCFTMVTTSRVPSPCEYTAERRWTGETAIGAPSPPPPPPPPPPRFLGRL